MDALQKELETTYPVLRIRLLGVNALGQEAGNAATTQGRELPWLQDVDADQDRRGDAATLWNPSYRSVYVLDGDNVQVAAFDVDAQDLNVAENYAALRELLIDAAMTSQRPWRNADNPLDVNQDDNVEPLDALTVINKLNAEGPHELPPPQAGDPPMQYYDCNGDGEVGPVDALNVINHLNARSGGANAEGEGWSKQAAASLAQPVSVPTLASPPNAVAPRSPHASWEATDDRVTPAPRDVLSLGEHDSPFPAAEPVFDESGSAETGLPKLPSPEPLDWRLSGVASDEQLPDPLG